ncbi:MAG: hypothetical protein ACI308_04965 [Muribaculaceae bacterium]
MILIISGCSVSNSHPKILDEAEKLMQSDPSEALSKLNAVDVSEFQDSATLARWALLYSEAMAFNKLSVPTDTIINIAIEYYGRHNFAAEFEKASRLKGQILLQGNVDAIATARYLQKEKEFFLYKERTKMQLFTSCGIIVFLLAFGTIVWLRQKVRMQTARNDVLLAEASGLKNQLSISRNDIGSLEAKLHALLENRFSLIDTLCQTYYESQGTKAERKAIIDKVKCEIDALRTDALPQMEQAVNDCRENLLVTIKAKYPDIKAEDYQLLVYITCGLSARTISLLIGASVDVVYKRKSRLKARLKDRNLQAF